MNPLHQAAILGDAAAVRRLLDAGADVDDREAFLGRTPLHVAAQLGRRDIVDLLLARGARIDIQDSVTGRTALHLAALEGHVGVVRALLSSGATVDQRAHAGETALHCAVCEGQLAAAELLVAAGADVNAEADGQVTALHFVLGTEACATPFGWATGEEGRLPIVQFLLQNGADAHAVNFAGVTPIAGALLVGYQRTAELLLDHVGAATDSVGEAVEGASACRADHPMASEPGDKLHAQPDDRQTALTLSPRGPDPRFWLGGPSSASTRSAVDSGERYHSPGTAEWREWAECLDRWSELPWWRRIAAVRPRPPGGEDLNLEVPAGRPPVSPMRPTGWRAWIGTLSIVILLAGASAFVLWLLLLTCGK